MNATQRIGDSEGGRAGAPGLVFTAGGRLTLAVLIDTGGEHIRAVYAIANPDKFNALAPATVQAAPRLAIRDSCPPGRAPNSEAG